MNTRQDCKKQATLPRPIPIPNTPTTTIIYPPEGPTRLTFLVIETRENDGYKKKIAQNRGDFPCSQDIHKEKLFMTTLSHEQEPQRWLIQQLQYTQEMEKVDPDGEMQIDAEEDIAMEMFFDFTEHTMNWRIWYVYKVIDDLFPCSLNDLGIYSSIEQCLTLWRADLKDKNYPDEDESNAVAKELVILGLSIIQPQLVEVVPPIVSV
jgi:hypothetical protein